MRTKQQRYDESNGTTPTEGFLPMKLKDLFKSDDMKASKKRKAFEKVLHKLEKKYDKLKDEFRAESKKKKRKRLLLKMKTNKRHRHKANNLLAELE